MLELVNLTKSYPTRLGRHYVFRDLNFVFPEGVSVGLMGRNGAGKSTLMQILGGVEVPDSGKIHTDKTISWTVGLSGGLQSSLTARDNVKFVCRIHGLGREEMEEKVRYVEDFADIGKFFDMPIKSYSSGMRSRVSFGLSMAFKFDYYLVDEGMSAGDPMFRKKASDAFKNRTKDANLILVSHNVRDIRNLCQMVVVLDGGRATLFEDVEEGLAVYQSLKPQTRVAAR